jgi:hypothetical protein
MATYMDGAEGGKHNSDNSESKSQIKSYTVELVFECVTAKDPYEAAQTVCGWLTAGASDMIYDIEDEDTGEKFTVDLAELDDDAVLPNN